MATPAGSWSDYWASLAAAQDYYSSGGDPNAQVALAPPTAAASPAPAPAAPAAAAPDPSAQAAVNTGGFTPITNPGFTQNNVGTGPIDQTPGSPTYGQPISTTYNSGLYADAATAQRIAQQLGGTVVQGDPIGMSAGSPFSAPQANMIQLPNGRIIDAGTIAGYESTYANDPNMLQALINSEITGQGQNPQSYQDTLSGYNPATVAAAAPAGQANPAPTPQQLAATTPPGVAIPNPGLNVGGTTTPPPGTTSPPGGAPPPGGTPPPYTPPPRAPGTTPQAPDVNLPGMLSGGYGAAYPKDMPFGTGAVGGFPLDANGNPTFTYNPSTNVGQIVQNDRAYAFAQGGELVSNYGQNMADYLQRGNQLGSVGDSLYAWLQANPGYTPDQINQIMNQSGLNALQWTDPMAQANFLTSAVDANGNPILGANGQPVGEQQAWMGDPYAAYRGYAQTPAVPLYDANGNPVLDANGQQVMQSQADYLNQLSRQYGANIQGMFDTGATAIGNAWGGLSSGLNAAIDPSKLGLSSQFTTNYNFGPQDMQNIINAAGRNVGLQTQAIQDQLQRQAAAAGTNAPLALSAALARQQQTGASGAADAMTLAAIQAKQEELQVQQTLEQMRLGTAQDISNRQMQAATTAGEANIAAQEYLTTGRTQAGLQTGQEQISEQNTIAGQEAQLTQAGEAAAAQRAQAMAQNRQQISQANQAAQFQRGSYIDQAASQRATQIAGAARADQTQARQDVRNEEQTALNQANSAMAGQLQAFTGVTGAGQASEQNVIKAAQLPTTLDKVIGAATSAAGGTGGSSARGDIVTRPTVKRIGESGPEIVIKLKGMGNPMTYRRRNEAAYA